MLSTIYKFELKKLFCSRVNMIAMAASAVLLVLLVVSSIYEARPVSREAAVKLNNSKIDEQLIEEMRPIFKYVSGKTVFEVTGEYEKYVPIIDVLDVMITAIDRDIDLTKTQADTLYELRKRVLTQRMESQGLSEKDKEFWYSLEAQIETPFVYRYHRGPGNLLRAFQALGFFVLFLSAIGHSGSFARETADRMNQLLLCSRYGKKQLYALKLAAGLTWILAEALIVFLSVMIPYVVVYGTEGMGEMLQLVKPLSMLPYSIGNMLAIYFGIYILAAVLYASVTMLLSVLTQNQAATTCGLMGYLLIDLFVELPERFGVLEKIWLLRPNVVLMNSGFSNYRLIHLAGRVFMNYQAAPVLYAFVIIAALLIGRRKYKGLQVGK
ncbi:MAG: ABC transporter permease subunit [Lachnospiraceae bacterium]|nr:ABC transporter permease subunit [Lachnospiraceae bacterium]